MILSFNLIEISLQKIGVKVFGNLIENKVYRFTVDRENPINFRYI